MPAPIFLRAAGGAAPQPKGPSQVSASPGATSSVDVEMRALLGDPEALDQWSGDAAANPCTHYANALRLRRHFGAQLMFVPGHGWHVWAPPWRRDEAAARRLAQQLGRIIATEAADKAAASTRADSAEARKLMHAEAAALMKWAATSEAAACIESSLQMAAVLVGIECKPRDLNADPWLLATPVEVIDLRTGEAREHCQADRITLCAGTHVDFTAARPAFDAMMRRIFRSNPGVVPYLQRYLGFTSTGCIHPEVLAVWFGTGGNGKSTLFAILQFVLGDYAGPTPPGLLITHRGERHPTELADLQGKRLMFACESGEGARLNEALVKQLTGGDRIKARRMHQDFYDFDPTHKLVLCTNHRPVIRGTDHGMWRRIQLVPFLEVIPVHERIAGIDEMLKAEAPGILAWIVEGARLYAADGRVDPPPEVVAASEAYRADSDVLGGFLADCCAIEPNASAKVGELFRAYLAWCEDNGERSVAQRAFSEALTERGIGVGRGHGGVRTRLGIRMTQATHATRLSTYSFVDSSCERKADTASPCVTNVTAADYRMVMDGEP